MCISLLSTVVVISLIIHCCLDFRPVSVKRKRAISHDKPIAKHQSAGTIKPRGRYGTSTPGPICSVGTFIQSALSKSTDDDTPSVQQRNRAEPSKHRGNRGGEGEGEVGGPWSLVGSAGHRVRGLTAKKRGNMHQKLAERRSTTARKKLKLGNFNY